MWKLYQIGLFKMRNDERVPDLISKLKSNNIWPHLCPKTVENRLNRVFRRFSTVLGSNRGQILFDLNFERPEFESSHHFASLWTTFDMIFTFWFFELWYYYFTTNAGEVSFFGKCKLWWAHRNQHKIMHQIGGWNSAF